MTYRDNVLNLGGSKVAASNKIANFNFPVIVRDDTCNLTLNQILNFFTGCVVIPPTGFYGCSLNFSATDPYPTASTCSNELKIPIKYNLYSDFKEACCMAFSAHGRFGLV